MRLPRWFMPVSVDRRVGGKYQLEGNAGGTVERCDPLKSFAATWEFGGQVSWLEVRQSAGPDGRTGSSWSTSRTSPTTCGSSSVLAPPASAGIWPSSAWPSPVVQRAGGRRGLAVVAGGVAFMKDSGPKWCEADIAFGTPEDKTRAACGTGAGFLHRTVLKLAAYQ